MATGPVSAAGSLEQRSGCLPSAGVVWGHRRGTAVPALVVEPPAVFHGVPRRRLSAEELQSLAFCIYYW